MNNKKQELIKANRQIQDELKILLEVSGILQAEHQDALVNSPLKVEELNWEELRAALRHEIPNGKPLINQLRGQISKWALDRAAFESKIKQLNAELEQISSAPLKKEPVTSGISDFQTMQLTRLA